ncbi:unnamed protein product [Symbiodinium sp. CCMP2592]|nr:unnamed protein product [Symbiodinium sp. CCMP2592]
MLSQWWPILVPVSPRPAPEIPTEFTQARTLVARLRMAAKQAIKFDRKSDVDTALKFYDICRRYILLALVSALPRKEKRRLRHRLSEVVTRIQQLKSSLPPSTPEHMPQEPPTNIPVPEAHPQLPVGTQASGGFELPKTGSSPFPAHGVSMVSNPMQPGIQPGQPPPLHPAVAMLTGGASAELPTQSAETGHFTSFQANLGRC